MQRLNLNQCFYYAEIQAIFKVINTGKRSILIRSEVPYDTSHKSYLGLDYVNEMLSTKKFIVGDKQTLTLLYMDNTPVKENIDNSTKTDSK